MAAAARGGGSRGPSVGRHITHAGFPLSTVGTLEAPHISQSGDLWLYSYASQKIDAKAHVDQHEWALPALAAAHTAPVLTGKVHVPVDAQKGAGGLGLALLAAGVVAAIDAASPIPSDVDSSSLPASPISDSSVTSSLDEQPEATAGNESPRETPERFDQEREAASSRFSKTATSLLVAPPGLEPGRPRGQGILKAIKEYRIVANRVNEGVLKTDHDGSHPLLTIQTHLLTIPRPRTNPRQQWIFEPQPIQKKLSR